MTWNIVQAVTIPVMADVRHGRRQRRECRLDHPTADSDGHGRNEHRGPGVSQAVRPHGRQRSDRGRGNGWQGPGLRGTRRDRLDEDFIINARTDVFAIGGLDEAVERCNRYLAAGADLAFIDGIKTRADIERAVAAWKGRSRSI